MGFDPNEPRAPDGKWTSGGGQAGSLAPADARTLAPQQPFATTKEANAWAAEHVHLSAPPSALETGAVTYYRRLGYQHINERLRFGGKGMQTVRRQKVDQAVRHLDAVIDRSRIDQDVTVLRTISAFADVDFAEGGFFADRGFCSTTISSKVADDFGSGPSSTRCRIHVPAGSKGIYLRERHECEVLLPRGCVFKVEKVETGPTGGKVVHLRLVAQNDDSFMRPPGADTARTYSRTAEDEGPLDDGRFIWQPGDLVPAPGAGPRRHARADLPRTGTPPQDAAMSPELAAVFAELEDPARYAQREANVFDEHAEDGKDGKTPERFDRARLERIAANCNARDSQGNLCPLTLGHTIPGTASEKAQPEIVGYARRFRVVYDPDLGRHVIRARYYIRREKLAEAEAYPRTSVERWPGDDVFDPIALLKRTPKQDLKQWTYFRSGNSGRQVIRYSMESRMADDMTPAPAAPAAPAPEPTDTAEHFIKTVLSHPYAKKYMAEAAAPPPGNPVEPPNAAAPSQYDAGPGVPSGTDTAIPGLAPAKKEPERMQQDSAAIRYSRLEAEVKSLRQVAEQYQKQAATAECERIVTQLEAENYELDRVAEVADMLPMSPAGREAHAARVRRYYRQAPIGNRSLPLDHGTARAPALDRETSTRASRLASQKGLSFDEALTLVQGK